MAKKLEGKVAVVTGAASPRGVGREVAKAMATEGAKVVVNDIGKGPDGAYAADKVVEEIKKTNGVAVANYDTVATMAGGENIINTAISNFGKIDILVNTAGNTFPAPFPDITEEQWDAIMDVHIKGHFSCSKAAIPHMMKQKSGRIINFSSRGAFFTSGRNFAYSSAKAGVMGFTVALSNEFKDYNITANCILPSAVTQLFPQEKTKTSSNMPLASDYSPEFVAPIVVYLATDEAKEITGQFIYAGGEDLCIYAAPFVVPPAHAFIRKAGKWTVDELIEAIPPLAGLG
ncbi:SDR family NAD(P)-dependent oxidoreductase [Chloroflexota bacterium]